MYYLYWSGDPYDNCFLESGSLEKIKEYIREYPSYNADDLEIYQGAGIDIYKFVEEARGQTG